jgi:nitrogen fixation protein
MANVDIRVGKKDAAFFAANTTLVLKDGQFIFNETTEDLYIGDGVTQLSLLTPINGGDTTNLVPYTGANQNVNLGEYELKAGQVTLDITPTGTAAVGTTRWNDTIGSSETTLKGGNVVLKNGVDLVARVVNKVTPNTTLTKAAYQAVRVSGAQGQRLAVALAQANNDNNSADTIGLVIETITTNQEGFIMTVGQLEGINTTGSLQGETWVDGDVIYLSPTVAGRLTNVKPTAPQHIVIIGYVEYAHANNGKLYVKVMNGWELEELHNVSSTNYTTPIDTDSVLTYDVTNSLWKRLTWSNIKATLKTYFDTIYTTTSAVASQITTALTGYATQAWVTSQGYITNVVTALGYTPENVANKSSSYTASSTTTYANTKALVDGLATKENSLGFTPENVANKENTTLDTSTTKYPTNNLVKTNIDAKVTANAAITGATKTKITYDSKGLVTSGADATTADIADSVDKRYVTDANLTVIGNTSGTNTGDQTLSGLGGVPTTRSITVNGTSADLSADRTFTVTDANLSTSDITDNNVSISKHGFAPKLPNDATKYLDGTGNYSVPGSNNWIDYSSTSTIVGWSSFTTKVLKYRVVGKQMFVQLRIDGTSNSTSLTFTLPNNAIDTVYGHHRYINNGTVGTALQTGRILGGANLFSAWTSTNAGTWTASGTKAIELQFFIEIA